MMRINRKKRILIFSLAYHPFIGGAELAVKNITDRLSVYDFDLVTLLLDSRLPQFERIGNVDVYRIGFGKKAPRKEELLQFPWYFAKVFYPPLAAWKALRLHRKKPYDAVWAIMAYAGFAAVIFRWRAKIPYILTLQEGDTVAHMTKRWRIRFVAPIMRAVFKTPTIVHSISNYLADFARHMGYRGNIEVIPNGVDIQKFKTQNSKRKIANQNSKVTLITVSRLVEKNAVDDIVRALALLGEDVSLRIVGAGYQERQLKLLVQDLKLENRVEFTGEVSHDILPTYLHDADIFIRPSRSEGMGSAFIEAMAAGLPVVATPVGGIPDFLKDGETGLFCEVNSSESIAKQVQRLIADESLKNRLVSNARAMVEEKYDWDIIAEDMHKKVFSLVLVY